MCLLCYHVVNNHSCSIFYSVDSSSLFFYMTPITIGVCGYITYQRSAPVEKRPLSLQKYYPDFEFPDFSKDECIHFVNVKKRGEKEKDYEDDASN